MGLPPILPSGRQNQSLAVIISHREKHSPHSRSSQLYLGGLYLGGAWFDAGTPVFLDQILQVTRQRRIAMFQYVILRSRGVSLSNPQVQTAEFQPLTG